MFKLHKGKKKKKSLFTTDLLNVLLGPVNSMHWAMIIVSFYFNLQHFTNFKVWRCHPDQQGLHSSKSNKKRDLQRSLDHRFIFSHNKKFELKQSRAAAAFRVCCQWPRLVLPTLPSLACWILSTCLLLHCKRWMLHPQPHVIIPGRKNNKGRKESTCIRNWKACHETQFKFH